MRRIEWMTVSNEQMMTFPPTRLHLGKLAAGVNSEKTRILIELQHPPCPPRMFDLTNQIGICAPPPRQSALPRERRLRRHPDVDPIRRRGELNGRPSFFQQMRCTSLGFWCSTCLSIDE